MIHLATLGDVTVKYVLLDDLPGQSRALVRLTGPDTARFVQGTVTADVAGAAPSLAVVAALCSPKGKILTELVILPQGETFDLLVPVAQAEALAENLDRHIIMDQVEVSRPEAPSVAVVWTDDGTEPPEPSGDVRHFRARHPGPGHLWLGSPDAVRAAVAEATAVDEAGWSRRRIETATPAWGHEIEPDVFPPERIHARGQVNRVMVRVHADAPVAPGTTLAGPDRPDAGRLTTVAPDGDGGGVVGLAIVRRDVAASGKALTAGDTTVTVTSGPLGDDPGTPGKGRSATVKLGGRR